MTTRKQIAWYAPRVISLCAALFGIFFFFYYMDILGRSILSVIKLENSPWFTGGKTAAVLFDPVGDDAGFGKLTYPTHEVFTKGSLDLLRYTVHEPIWNVAWAENPQVWQISFSFASGPANARNIRVYIDVDGTLSGRTSTRDELGEGVSFDPSAPWDYCLAIEGTEGSFSSADGSFSEAAVVVLSDDGKDVTVRIPLSDRRLVSLYITPETSHYVFVGGWTPWARDGFVPVARRASSGTGGGAVSFFSPKIYDSLVSEGRSQEADLSAWDEDSFTIPVMYPVRISMRAPAKANAVYGASGERLSELAKLNDEEVALSTATALETWERLSNSATEIPDMDVAHAAFSAGKLAMAEDAFDRVLSRDENNASALAYKGAIVAQTAADASPLSAVEIVSSAYRYLDRAVALAKTPEEILDARISRGNVSMAIPETVFGKAAEGGADFLVAAGIADSPAMAAEMYVNAARCMEAAGKKDEAGSWYREAARRVKGAGDGSLAGASDAGPKVSAWVLLELVKRGYLE
jgi:tetratricopeptide (TPR) repeat protein